MVMVQVTGENPSGVACIQYDHMIKALPSQRSDQPFNVGILPGAPRSDENLFDAQTRDPPAKCFSIYRVAIPNEISRSPRPREGFDNLLRCPLRGRVLRDVEINDLASVMEEDDQHEQHFEVDRRNRKEVDRYEIRDVVLQERPPRRGWRLARADPILLYRRFRDRDTELSQLANDAGRAPVRVSARDPANQLSDFDADCGPPGRAMPADARPVFTESPPLPCENRGGLHERQDLTPSRPVSR